MLRKQYDLNSTTYTVRPKQLDIYSKTLTVRPKQLAPSNIIYDEYDDEQERRYQSHGKQNAYRIHSLIYL